MGRPEAPVDRTVPALGFLADYLRGRRRQANLRYDQLAERTGYSAAHLKRAASGKTLPTLPVVMAYAAGCGHLDPLLELEIQNFYAETCYAVEEAERKARRSSVLPKPQYASDDCDLSRAMREAWAYSGRPSTRRVALATDGQVPRSTAAEIANGHAVPRDVRQYIAFLQACEIYGRALAPWFRAWFRIKEKPSTAAAISTLQFLSDKEMTIALLTFAEVYAEDTPSPRELRDRLLEAVLVSSKVTDADSWCSGWGKEAITALAEDRIRKQLRYWTGHCTEAVDHPYDYLVPLHHERKPMVYVAVEVKKRMGQDVPLRSRESLQRAFSAARRDRAVEAILQRAKVLA